ncbi:UNVERIFIED_CONTAM: hypothetical protein K2H54_038137 [Gekko kuhli]
MNSSYPRAGRQMCQEWVLLTKRIYRGILWLLTYVVEEECVHREISFNTNKVDFCVCVCGGGFQIRGSLLSVNFPVQASFSVVAFYQWHASLPSFPGLTM